MHIPWRVLAQLGSLDLQVYAILTTSAQMTAVEIAVQLPVSAERVQAALERLQFLQFVTAVEPGQPGSNGEDTYIPFRVYRYPSLKRTRDQIQNTNLRAYAREESTEGSFARAREGKVRTREGAKAVYETELPSGTFSVTGILGCFYSLYKEHTGLDYRGSSFQEELREAELLAYTASDAAIWCVRAFFSEHMAWVKNKSLTFLSNASHIHRFVLGVAMEVRAKTGSRPEWQGSAVGTVHRPKR